MLILSLLSLAFAGDEDAGALTYDGGLSGSAPNYKPGKPVSITHSSGNVQVRCLDTNALSGRLQYTVFGSAEGAMESFGKGIGLSVYGDANGGGAKTRVPSRTGGVSRAQVDLTVNIPKGTSALSVTQTGDGWVQVVGCSGVVKVSGGTGGVYVGGPLSGFSVTAAGGDVKVEVDEGVLTAASSASSPGNLTVNLTSAQGGKLTVKGSEVSVRQTVLGTNTPTLVQGDLGIAGPTITLSAKGRAEVGEP